MKGHFILSAIETIKERMIWLHPEFTSLLISQIPTNPAKSNENYLSLLSEREKEGDTYKQIAEELSITPRTVKAHASSSYAKLNVKDRLSLALLFK